MSKKFNSNDIENNKFNLNNEESEYTILIKRLKEIQKNISLLEQIIFK
jgi:hypothetical protein